MDYRSNGGVREPRSGHADPGRYNVSEIMTGIERPTDRQEIYDELGAARATFHGLLDSMSPENLRRPARDTKWNNEELLFHMLFGYIIVLSLIWIVKLFGWLPRPFSRLYSILLNLLTGPFNTVNYLGSRLGAKVYNHSRMGPKFDKVCASLHRGLARESERNLRRGMHFPRQWDPFFKDYMTLADIYHYPTQHFTFHSRQLSAGSPQQRLTGLAWPASPAGAELPVVLGRPGLEYPAETLVRSGILAISVSRIEWWSVQQVRALASGPALLRVETRCTKRLVACGGRLEHPQ